MVIRKEIMVGGRTLIIETGRVAKQADGAAWVQYGETVVLATAVAAKEPTEGQDFFPLTVDYREKAYATGRIPGGFFKREGKPTEREIVSSRLIDRSLRPLFPKAFRNEVQILVNVLSADQQNEADILGVIAASTALCLSPIPFAGPVASVRIGRVRGEWLVNPTYAQVDESDMDVVASSTTDFVVMVEGEAKEISEEDLVQALELAQGAAQATLRAQEELAQAWGTVKMPVPEPTLDPALIQELRDFTVPRVREVVRITEKKERRAALEAVVREASVTFAEKFAQVPSAIPETIAEVERELVRQMLLRERRRLDGRTPSEIRPITAEVGVLPRAHGSALFTRGQTQALAATTLGTKMDEQKIEDLEGEFWKSYMLHYNFPPFSVGEVRPVRGPGRREVGHGYLAERALKPMIPSEEIFPYTIRVVSDILESNGSSSMATVCAGSLSLMDAGVPVKGQVAGIAMGLVKEGDQYATLTDILGDEDHLGDMDFKVAGTERGITAFQMDVKSQGISSQILREALAQAREARLSILEVMNATLPRPRPEISKYAPRIITMKVAVEDIGTVIGPGGKTIREIIDKTGTTIDIDDDGRVTIASQDPEAAKKAKELIEALVAKPEVGHVYVGRVKKIMPFGAFVEILPGKEGLLHISEIEHRRIERVEDVLKVGDEVTVKLISVESDGKLDLSRKALIERDAATGPPPPSRSRPAPRRSPSYDPHRNRKNS